MKGEASALLEDKNISEHYLGTGKDIKEGRSNRRRQRIVW